MAEDRIERDAATSRTGDAEDGLTIPLREERVQIEKRLVDLGYVEIRRTVITEQVMVPVELRREEIEIRRIDAEEGVLSTDDAPGAFVGSTLRIPVLRERAVIQKEVVVTGEVVLHRTQDFELVDVDETVRRERVTVDEIMAAETSERLRDRR